MALCLAPLFCACAYALITLHRKLTGAAYETVPPSEMCTAPGSLEDEGYKGPSSSGIDGRDIGAAPSATCGRTAPLLSVSTVSDIGRGLDQAPAAARRCDAHLGAEQASAPPLTSCDLGQAGKSLAEAGRSPMPASNTVPLLTGPPRSGFGKAADAVLQAALDKQRAHTDEVLRRALAEKERIFESMREQSKREMSV